MEEKNNFVHGVAYGKLYLAGEYAILEDYASALITSVPKKITVFIEESDKTTIFDTINKTSVGLFEKNSNFTLVQQFIQFLTKYTNSDKTFSLTIFNELHSDDKKYGLGSSGAVLVAIARAILSFENITYNDLTIFKLVALFNIKHNLSGSMGDVAASINDGITFYQKFNAEFVNEMIRQNKTVKEIINTNWDGLLIEKIHPKADLSILARWTGKAVDTKEHVKLWKQHKDNYKDEFKVFVETSNHLVKTLKDNLVETDASNALNTINKLRENLLYLESFSKIPMETNAMKNYIDSHSAGKQSGSGSGDIVLGFEKNNDKYQLQLNLEKL
ncbi:MAG: phosphomevalonate kinase [Gemella haemolysans]|uniref:mevalonate kinase family protein n=1 Tax=Gemella haemolysans TaxID=1379 RepID=UPI00290A9CB0|nr:phosphomevalonate kinase [Gemella haemolysans]MDU6573683.1 phosphomevalonate kinase [Gemella haemolysans]